MDGMSQDRPEGAHKPETKPRPNQAGNLGRTPSESTQNQTYHGRHVSSGVADILTTHRHPIESTHFPIQISYNACTTYVNHEHCLLFGVHINIRLIGQAAGTFFFPFVVFSFDTLLLCSIWTSRGHKCRPFFPPVLAFIFCRA